MTSKVDEERKKFEARQTEEENKFNREQEEKFSQFDNVVDDETNEIKADIDTLMRKYDRESNTRIWVGKPKVAISIILAMFSI